MKTVTMEDLNNLLCDKKADPAEMVRQFLLLLRVLIISFSVSWVSILMKAIVTGMTRIIKSKLYISQDGVKDAVAQIAQWYADGILYKDFNTLDTNALRELATMRPCFLLSSVVLWNFYGLAKHVRGR